MQYKLLVMKREATHNGVRLLQYNDKLTVYFSLTSAPERLTAFVTVNVSLCPPLEPP